MPNAAGGRATLAPARSKLVRSRAGRAQGPVEFQLSGYSAATPSPSCSRAVPTQHGVCPPLHPARAIAARCVRILEVNIPGLKDDP